MKSRELSLEEYRARVARALAYIQENLAGDLDLDSAAKAACFSKYHFHRIFSATVGETFADYVRRLRLERGANLLSTRPGLSVTEAAMASGFSSPSVFSRVFSAHFGQPPSEWQTSAEVPASLGPGCLGLATREIGPLHLASIMSTSGYGEGIGQAWSRLYRWAGPRGLLAAAPQSVGIAWDSPEITAPDRCRYSVCLACPQEIAAAGEVVLLDFPRRLYLVLSYRGPNLAEAYTYLYGSALPSSGFEPFDAPALEFYRSVSSPMTIFDLDIALPVVALG